MRPIEGLAVGVRYDRRQIAELLGRSFSRYWEQGVVRVDDDYLLFVTLDKTGRPPEARYRDSFLSPATFSWQSQNQDSRSKRGAKYRNRGQRNLAFHLFVRRAASSTDGRAAKFVYLGRVRFKSWDGDNPISIDWSLDVPVSPDLRAELQVPDQP